MNETRRGAEDRKRTETIVFALQAACPSFSAGLFPHQQEASDLLPELNGVDLAMSLSPKSQPHTTPFSVTDILSPMEETYRKLELYTPSSPYRSSTGGSSAGGSSSGPPTASPSAMSSSYVHVHQFPPQYCNGADISYGNSTASWYGATANDPRFASKSNFLPTFTLHLFIESQTIWT
ncbi:unnamed protein product [Bemisia tabaci]|uniref:Uncharacterized protein n=1 Tax=Bemisia tabaci TaxID=7038 RepID=A0A9P0A5V9_BEMTA|nr:unnamed protein product [Bemisia tabaci]